MDAYVQVSLLLFRFDTLVNNKPMGLQSYYYCNKYFKMFERETIPYSIARQQHKLPLKMLLLLQYKS